MKNFLIRGHRIYQSWDGKTYLMIKPMPKSLFVYLINEGFIRDGACINFISNDEDNVIMWRNCVA